MKQGRGRRRGEAVQQRCGGADGKQGSSPESEAAVKKGSGHEGRVMQRSGDKDEAEEMQ